MKDKKGKVQYYDWYSLYEVTNPKGGIENFMVAIIICKQGYLKLRIGLVDALINPNMVLIIFPEQIFQPTEVSPDFEAGYILLSKVFFDIQNDFKIVSKLMPKMGKI